MAYGFNENKTKAQVYSKTEMNSWLLVEKKSIVSGEISTSAVGTITVSGSVAKSGYTPIGIVGIQVSYGSTSTRVALWGQSFTFGGYRIDGTTANVFYNKYKSISTAGKLYVDLYVLYRKNI